jgi:Tfp pilus assembly PilM family ATPase
MRSSYYAGFSFYKGQIQLAELDHGRKKTVTALNERSSAVDLSRDVKFSADHPQLHTFIYELEEMIKENKLHSKTVSFALPTEPLLMSVIPIDPTLQGPGLTSHLQWEFEQFYPNVPVKDYVVSAYPIPGPTKGIRQAFLVGVQRGTIAFLKRAASELRLQVFLIDIDHFSVEKTLRHCHPELLKDDILLIGVRGGCIDASLVAEGQYVDYRAFTVHHADDLKKAIVEYRQYLEQKDGIESLSKIVLYGYDVNEQTMNQIQGETGIPTMALNAMSNLEPSKRLDEAYVSDSSRFSAAIGLALRTQ